jgi:alkaline phosphatase/alkaline phosphatase D
MKILSTSRVVFVVSATIFVLSCAAEELPPITHAQGEMAGEVTASSVILQSRLTTGSNPHHGPSLEADVPGAPGVARFELSTDPEFADSFATDWLTAAPEYDFIVKTRVTGLESGTRYYYRLEFGRSIDDTELGPRCTFGTHDGPEVAGEASFVVVTGMNYAPFHLMYEGEDRQLGYPTLETILDMHPDFFVATGDNVYYDGPSMKSSIPAEYRRPAATTEETLRRKWHQQLVQPRFVQLFAEVPTYWEKDDHDYRYNDCDNTGDEPPSLELGKRIFLEQVPVVDPSDPHPKTYRTHRVNRDLQIWLTEGRDYRSPNMMESGPDKTMWGFEQREWLKRTLLESDATFKVLISPTPMIGPDDLYKKGPSNPGDDDLKRDNQSNPTGFQHERDEFFSWLLDNEFLDKGFYIVCGDRHWQYHSISPEGIEEFSSGALIDQNSRLGRLPGDPESNDPEAKIRQPYTQDEKSGGFVLVSVDPGQGATRATMTVTWYDEYGVELYSITRAGTR